MKATTLNTRWDRCHFGVGRGCGAPAAVVTLGGRGGMTSFGPARAAWCVKHYLQHWPVDQSPSPTLPASIVDADGDRLNLCPGGCGTYVDDLNVNPYCDNCTFDILVGDGIPRAQVTRQMASRNPDEPTPSWDR
jgi:hypothetical protein